MLDILYVPRHVGFWQWRNWVELYSGHEGCLLVICIYPENLIAIKQNYLYLENFLIGYILFKVNQTKFQLPENIFQVNELAHCLDFYEDARRRNSWKRNLVSMACIKRKLDHQ